MSENYNPLELLRDQVLELDKNLKNLNDWINVRETDRFGTHYRVNEKTRLLYHYLRPALINIENSLTQIAILLEEVSK